MQATVTNMQVAVKYPQNFSSLSLDMSADYRRTTLRRHISQHIGQLSVNISSDAQPMCWPTHLSYVQDLRFGSVMYNSAKFFAVVLRFMVVNRIINSENFINKITDLELFPGQKLVSYSA